MKITKKQWNKYINALARVSEAAAEEMRAFVQKNGISNTEAVIAQAYALSTKYGEATGALACEMYDSIATAQKAKVASAVPAETVSLTKVRNSVYAIRLMPVPGEELPKLVGRLVKQVQADTMLKNAKRDRAEWAWINDGGSCAFCTALASQGWLPASKAQMEGGHASHIHNNCRCEFAIRFEPLEVEGYDPEALREEYNEASNGNSASKIKAMRRANYQQNRDKITLQQREAYKRRQEALNDEQSKE